MALNLRKHDIPAGTDASITRATIFETFGNSINDIIPVSGNTERAQVISDLIAAGFTIDGTHPVFIYNAANAGLHRVEVTFDGTVFIPMSGVLEFASTSARDTWTSSNGALLRSGDKCIVGAVEYSWVSGAWAAPFTSWTGLAATNGWTANSGSVSPQVMRDGYVAWWRGGMFGGASGDSAATLPAWARPSRTTRVHGIMLANNSDSGRARIEPNGQIFFSGSLSQDTLFPWSVL